MPIPQPRERRRDGPISAALAASFVASQFYTSLAALSNTPPVGILLVGRAGAAAIAALIVGGALLAGIVIFPRFVLPEGTRPLAGWLAIAAVSTLLGFDPAIGAGVTGLMLCTGLVHVAIVRRAAVSGAVPILLASYLAAGTAAAAAGIAMHALRRPEALYVANLGRAASVFVTANQFAAFLVTFVPTAVGVALAASDRRVRVLAALCASTGLIALVLTFSRSGWLAVLGAGMFLAWTTGRRRAASVLGICILAAGIGLALRPGVHHNPAEGLTRLGASAVGLRVAELFPLVGVGPMAYRHAYALLRTPQNEPIGSFASLHPHDAYLSLAAEEGVTGLGLAALGWWRFARTMRERLRGTGARERILALGVCAGLVGTLVQGLFDTVGVVEETFTWIPFMGLAFAIARVPEMRP